MSTSERCSFTNGRQGEKIGKKKMCQNIGDEVYLFYIFIIYIVDIGKIIIKECENDRMNDQEGSTKGTGASHARRRPVASIPEITVCHVRQPWLSTSRKGMGKYADATGG